MFAKQYEGNSELCVDKNSFYEGNNKRWVPSAKVLWVLFFCYTAFVAVIFQKLLLPLMPSLHAGHGLLATHDPQLHHAVAVTLSEQIHDFGWSQWTLWPHHGSGLNASLLAVLYLFFGPDPLLLIPIHAALHATSGLLLFFIGRLLWPGRVGTYGGLIAAILFVIFPSPLNWYAQPLKDGYAIVGLLLILYLWVRWVIVDQGWRNIIVFVLGNFVGALLLASVRPYGLQILLAVLSAAYLAVIPSILTSRTQAVKRVLTGMVGILPVLLFALTVKGLVSMDQRSDVYVKLLAQSTQVECSYSDKWSWQPSSWMPTPLDRYAERVSTIRAGITCVGYNAYSTIDKDVMPANVIEMVEYLPRGLQIALWAPFPDTWFSDFALTHVVGWAETIAWYLLMPGILVTIYYRRTPGVILAVVFAIGFLVVYGYVTANVGTLHRVRYPFLFVLVLLGSLGWVRMLTGFQWRKKAEGNVNEKESEEADKQQLDISNNTQSLSRKGVASAGILVSLFTAGIYLLLFLRDVLMARWFGLGPELDAFFLAMVVPMFVANVVNVPFGAIVVPLYQQAKTRLGQQEVQSLVANLFFLNIVLLGGVSLIVLLFGSTLLNIVGWGFDAEQLALAQYVLPFCASILLWSGSVVLCNSVLNAHNCFVAPALAQIVVPIIAILALLLYGHTWGVVAVAAGMALGQVINLIIVIYLVRKNGVAIALKWPSAIEEWRTVLPMFFTLVIAALFVNAVVLVDNSMASTLELGSVGAYGLGSKVTIFVTGVIGAGIIAVMLPHFSQFFASEQIGKGQQELRFYLLMGTAISIPVGLVLFSIVDDMVRMVFMGGALDAEATITVGKVAVFGVIQLPFFTCYMVLMKFANAFQKNGAVLVSSVFGLALNVILNLVLMGQMGVAGLALSTSLSMFATSILLMFLIHNAGHVAIIDILRILLLWLLYLAVVSCLYVESYTGAVIAGGAALLLAAGQRRQLPMESQSVDVQ